MIQSITILGGGSAGLIAALGLRARLRDVQITVVRSLALGVIGVGEGTTLTVPGYLHQYLGLNRAEFFQSVDPSYKRGVRFQWGPRPYYDYAFGNNLALKLQGLDKPFGYYCDEEFSHTNPVGSLMAQGRFFLRGGDGKPVYDTFFGYHFENAKLVSYLESTAAARGITFIDDELVEAALDDAGVSELRLASGRSVRSDLYVDASGFRCELLGRALGEPFVSFKSSLFCERAVVGGWERTTEPVLPYTSSETMDAGWCWQIEHRTRINRGYVYSPDFISDTAAEEEFRRNNPRISDTRVVKFVSGRRQNGWVKNVVAVGTAAGDELHHAGV
jgi:tryptophan halogenase